MKLLKTLALALCLAFLFITLSSKAQTIDPTTGNLITGTWQGTTPGNYQGFSGGYMPGYVAGDKAIVFGYSTGTASQSISVANALANAGSGIEVKGYTYSWYYYNNDANRGNLSGTISLKGSAGNILESYNYTMPQTGIGNWIPQSGTQMFTNQYQVSQLSTLDVSFTGKDDRFWAGYYGPAIKAINVKLAYGVDPCKTNPAYSPSCTGFDTVLTSNNLVPNPNGYAVFGDSINQSYAINTALASAGSGAMVHGFQWGYTANANGPYCALWILFCFDERSPSVTTNVNITNSSGASLYNVTRNYQNSYNDPHYSYLFPSSQQMSTLGNFNFTATTNDQAYIGNMYSRALYTVDPCVSNVFSSSTCKGYYEALAKLTPQPIAQPASQNATPTGVTSNIETVSITTTGTTGGSNNNTGNTSSGMTQPAETQSTPQQTVVASSSTPATSASQQTTVAQSSPAAAVAKVGEVSDSGGGSSKTTVSLSSVLSMIGSNQEKTAALEKSVVQAADAQAFSAGEAAKQNAEKIAGEAQSQSASAGGSQSVAGQSGTSQSFSGPSSNGAVALQGNLQSNTVMNSARLEQSLAGNNSGQTSSSSNMNMGIQQNIQIDTKQDFIFSAPQSVAYVPKLESSNKLETNAGSQLPKYEQPMINENMGMNIPVANTNRQLVEVKQDTQANIQIAMVSPIKYESPKFETTISSSPVLQYQAPIIKQDINVSAVYVQPISYSLITPTRQSQQVQIEMPTLEGMKFGHKGPVENAIDAKPLLQQLNTGSQQTDTVKKNVQNNELAGGVSIESIAKQPANYAQYFTMIPDSAFYEPKEIYKNQKTIDNARALRSLSSDRLHQEMINQQYKLGN